ncbi:MAG: hypothetical protein AB7F88_13810 [Pyrinomonadaceae bacterium]
MIDALYATIPVKAFKNLLLSPSSDRTTAQTTKSETLDIMNFTVPCQPAPGGSSAAAIQIIPIMQIIQIIRIIPTTIPDHAFLD